MDTSEARNTTVFRVMAEDITRGEGPNNQLLAADDLGEEVLELMEEGKVPEGGQHGQRYN